MKFYFVAHKDEKGLNKFKLNERSYYGIEQEILENPTIIETESEKEVDWNIIDDAKEILSSRIKTILKKEGDSDHLKRIVKCTVDAYENALIYGMYYPGSDNNPWSPSKSIIYNGCLFLVSDDRYVMESYQKKYL